MRNAYIKYVYIHVVAGTAIDVACKEAIHYAFCSGVEARFDFNGVAMVARGTDRVETLVKRYHEEFARQR